mgnify:CR=1 FL=1
MSEQTNKVNEAIFRGRIASIRGKGVNGSLVIACPMVTTTNKGGKLENSVVTNFPALDFNKNTTTKDIPQNFKVGDHVVAKGYVQTYFRMDEHTGEVQETTGIYIRELLHDNSKMTNAFGAEGRYFPEAQNEVYLSGPVAGISKRSVNAKNPNFAIVQLRLDLSVERQNMVNALYFRAPQSAINGIRIGDTVDILAMIQTADIKKEKKSTTGYQSIVVMDMAFHSEKSDQ